MSREGNREALRNWRPTEYVYLFRIFAEECPVKIGVSGSPAHRLSSLAIGIPWGTELIGIVESANAYEMEEMLHARYADKRMRGEWFRLTHEDIAELIGEFGFWKPEGLSDKEITPPRIRERKYPTINEDPLEYAKRVVRQM